MVRLDVRGEGRRGGGVNVLDMLVGRAFPFFGRLGGK